MVHSAHLDLNSKAVSFKVARKNAPAGSSVDTVSEDDIAYAINCPVVLTSANDEVTQKIDCEIMFAQRAKGENGTAEFSYMVRYVGGGSMGSNSHVVTFEESVKASRLQYRETTDLMMSKKKQNHGGKQGAPQQGKENVVPPCSSASEGEGESSTEPADPSVQSMERSRKPNVVKMQQKRKKDLRGLPKMGVDTREVRASGPHRSATITPKDKTPKRPPRQPRDCIKIHPELSSKVQGRHEEDRYEKSVRKPAIGDKVQGSTVADQSKGLDLEVVHHKDHKRKAEMTGDVSEKRIRWEPPHSWFENDGAI